MQDSVYQVANVGANGFDYQVADVNVQDSVYQDDDAAGRVAAAKLEAEFEAKRWLRYSPRCWKCRKPARTRSAWPTG